MSVPRPPSPKEQIAFLRSFQRLLDEGSFVATYKFALLHAIADLCVLRGDDSGAALELSTRDIADHFIRLYWPQVVPFVTSGDEEILRQNTGRQAAVVREVRQAHERYDGSLPMLQRDASVWARMLSDMIEGAWSHFVQRHNPRLLEHVTDLRSFLFGSERTALGAARVLLRDLQEGDCFYCARPIDARADVDHFISWRRYPLDLGHNLVLAHRACNSNKSDLLAAEEHLERWVDRNRTAGPELESRFDAMGIQHDWSATVRVAGWAYGQVHTSGGQVWVQGSELRALSDGWGAVLGGR